MAVPVPGPNTLAPTWPAAARGEKGCGKGETNGKDVSEIISLGAQKRSKALGQIRPAGFELTEGAVEVDYDMDEDYEDDELREFIREKQKEEDDEFYITRDMERAKQKDLLYGDVIEYRGGVLYRYHSRGEEQECWATQTSAEP